MSERGAPVNVVEVIIDETLPPLERVKQYGASEQFEHRLYIMRELVEHASAIGYSNSTTHLVEVMENLMYDKEVTLKLKLAENITPFTLYLLQQAAGEKKEVFDKILPIYQQILLDKESRDTAMDSFIKLCKEMSSLIMKDFIIPFLEKLSNEGEENKVVSVTLSNKISAIAWGKDMTISYWVPLLQNKIVIDTFYRVRMAMVSTMPSLFELLGIENTTTLLLPLYVELAKDEVWAVRKSCAEIIGDMAKNIPQDKCNEVLLPLVEALASDSSRWVRTATYSNLGLFISIQRPVKMSLVELFCGLATDSPATEYCDLEHPRICAFNFPAILHTLGPTGWPSIQKTYLLLAFSNQRAVRKAIAVSLHVIADILGEKLAEEVLMPIFDYYLRDFDDIKKETFKIFVPFLRKISMNKRKSFLWVLDEVQHSAADWRFRKIIGESIGDLSLLFDSGTSLKEIVPYFFALAQDPVAKIRKITIAQVNKILEALSSSQEHKREFISKLINLSNSSSYQQRLIYSKICGIVVNQIDPESFKDHFLTHLLKLLTSDKVVNCKIITAMTLLDILHHDKYRTNSSIISALNSLKADNDKDLSVLIMKIKETTKKKL